MGSILRAIVVPPYGGDTQFTNLAAAYATLSPEIRHLVDQLHAVHESSLTLARGDISERWVERFQPKDIRSVHPVVRVHPETGEKVLFVNPRYTTYVTELTRKESRHLLALLFEHLTNPELTCRFRWEPDSVAFWDNRASCHIVPIDVPEGMERRMNRVMIAGDTPVGVDGRPSFALAGGAPDPA
jgi:taurine dioxygenase